MNFFDLVNISEQYMTVLNPSTPEKIVRVGAILGLKPGMRVIDFGCGFAETLVLWGREYGVSGLGIDIRPYACERARARLADADLTDRFEIVCADASKVEFAADAYDAAACIGATFIWGGFRQTVQAMRPALRSGGKMAIGDAFWLHRGVPPEFAKTQDFPYETDILRMTREEGYDLEYVVHASQDDWDRYEADNWHGLARWIADHPDHPERQEVINFLLESQDEHFNYMKGNVGWGIYVLTGRAYQ